MHLRCAARSNINIFYKFDIVEKAAIQCCAITAVIIIIPMW